LLEDTKKRWDIENKVQVAFDEGSGRQMRKQGKEYECSKTMTLTVAEKEITKIEYKS